MMMMDDKQSSNLSLTCIYRNRSCTLLWI